MKNKKIQISIITVNYKVEKELIACITSILKSKTKIPIEIIVVDNDEESKIESRLKEKFPKLIYIKSSKNIGFGAGNNLGAEYAKGDFFFFLNPDTIVLPLAIESLVNFLQKDLSVGIVAPLFLDKNSKVYSQQGSRRLTPINGIFTLSFLNKLFPNNAISKEYLLSDWNKIDAKEVDVVPGTGFVMRRKVFEEAGGFDENFFLYFEEFDFCNRVKKLGYKIFIIPKAKVKHIWEASTKKANFNVKKIFEKSRFYYFRKYYGLIAALLVESIVRINKSLMILTLILITGAFLRFYRLGESLPFIGDYGWFYLSARDMIITGKIPLVGITSSHTWLHQGPFWTYVLSLILRISNFNPVSAGIFTAALGTFTIFLVYKIAKEMFLEKVGLISGLLYATSFLVIAHARSPYHTSPIPFFTVLLLFSTYKWIKGKIIFFPISIFFLAILYNFELATQVLWFVFFTVLAYGIIRKKIWAVNLITQKILVLSFFSFVIPMLPVILYDFTYGFSQTVKFFLWISYKIYSQSFSTHWDFMLMFAFFAKYYQRLIFILNPIVSFFIFLLTVRNILFHFYKYKKKHKFSLSLILVNLFIVIPIAGFLINKTPSEAYLPILFPTIIIATAWAFSKTMEIKKLAITAVFFLLLVAFSNSFSYLISINNDSSFRARINAAQRIILDAKGKEYNLVGKGTGSQFESFTMNYEYLSWWLGKAPSKKEEKLKFFISETESGIKIEKKIIR